MPHTWQNRGTQKTRKNPTREQGPMAIQVFPTYVNGKCTMVMMGMLRCSVNEKWICPKTAIRREGPEFQDRES